MMSVEHSIFSVEQDFVEIVETLEEAQRIIVVIETEVSINVDISMSVALNRWDTL